MLITVFTPAYNRAGLLPRVYESLCKQTFRDFEWVVVDDGSTDDTKSVVQSFIKDNSELRTQNSRFSIRYFYKENGGKPSAFNLGIEKARGELFAILDSDDMLTPDALETIHLDSNIVFKKGLSGVAYLKGYINKGVIGNKFPKDGLIDNYIDVHVNQGAGGDKMEVWVTKLLNQYRYPIFSGEKFIGETYIWFQLADKTDMLFRNKLIYLAEYLEDGLSNSGRTMRIKCPLGGIELCKICMSPRFNLKFREKKTILYVAYHFFAKKKFCELMQTPYKLLVLINYVPGFLLYKYWSYRFLK